MMRAAHRSHEDNYTQNRSRFHNAFASRDEARPVRVMIPPKYWTAVRRVVFDDVLPNISSTLGQILYLLFYDAAWHTFSDEKAVNASIAQLSRWTNADWRSVNKCLSELTQKRFVHCVSSGTSRSRSDVPCWRVPLAQFDMTREIWTPVPRFLIREYPRFYPNAVLLVVLTWIQDRGHHEYSWPGVSFLAGCTNWSARKVYGALHIMGHQKKWESLGKAAHGCDAVPLPWPLEIIYSHRNGQTVRHFRVRALKYERTAIRKWPSVYLDPEFAQRFKAELSNEPTRDAKNGLETERGDG